MKVFISHKSDDSLTASEIKRELTSLGVDAYLDLLDNISSNGKELTEHIKKRLNECTDLLVVMSEKTKNSMWVPFEVGMASQRDFPIVNFLKSGVVLPDFLEYWPRLRYLSQLRIYVNESKNISNESYRFATQDSKTARFYQNLKSKLY